MRILGIDPGLRTTGWGIIEKNGNRLSHVAHGFVKPPTGGSLAERLAVLCAELETIEREYRPDCAAVEETFSNRNPKSTLILGHARAIALLVPARAGLSVAEYAPNRVKLAVVGTGHAAKEQVIAMVRRLLPTADLKQADAADALAVAICHAHFSNFAAAVERGAKPSARSTLNDRTA